MWIDRFRIQGFKSISDLTVEGLTDINVFFGLNNVGKSNIFQAIELWHWLLNFGSRVPRTGIQPVKYSIPLDKLENKFGSALVRLGTEDCIYLQVELMGDGTTLVYENERLTINITLKLLEDQAQCEVESLIEPKNRLVNLPFEQLVSALPKFHVVHATRRLQSESRLKRDEADPRRDLVDSINDLNLKRAIFYAYLSSDMEQKKRVNAIKQILADIFGFGELDIALGPRTERINIGFIRPDGRLPIENLGTGAQQLLLVLGQIFLNDYPVIAVEEPEMNLSPQYQEHLMVALRKLMEDPAVKLSQLFISTHSPYFEFSENFYDVILDPMVGTQVMRATAEKHSQYFSVNPIGPDSGARLNSLNQVKLYDGLIQDLALQRGDLVIFVRNDAGRWEIRPAEELAHELQAITNGKG